MTAMEFLQQINHNQDMMHHMAQCFESKGNVVVIGGGSVAVDTARAAVRSGASSVTVVCLESGEQVPAHRWELEEAKEEDDSIFFAGDVNSAKCSVIDAMASGRDTAMAVNEKLRGCGLKDAMKQHILQEALLSGMWI